MYRFSLRLIAVALVTAALPACGNDTPTSPTPTTPTFVTDIFTGALARNAGVTHEFPVASSGLVTATLTRLGDPEGESPVVGFTLGTWNGAYCSQVIAIDRATRGAIITGQAGTSGQLCVRLYDNGLLADAVEYEVTVVHP